MEIIQCPNCEKELGDNEIKNDTREPNKFYEYFCLKCRSSGIIKK